MAHVRRANDDFRFMRKLLFGNLHRPLATLAKMGHLNPRSIFIKN